MRFVTLVQTPAIPKHTSSDPNRPITQCHMESTQHVTRFPKIMTHHVFLLDVLVRMKMILESHLSKEKIVCIQIIKHSYFRWYTFDFFFFKSIIGPDSTLTTSLSGSRVTNNTALGALFTNLK